MTATPSSPVANFGKSAQRLIGQLRRSSTAGADELAAVLEACSPAQPCRSAACPVCGVAFQQVAVTAVDRFIREPARAVRGRMHAITIVPASGCVAPGKLGVKVFKQVAREVAAALRSLDFPPTVFGLEASYNDDLTGKVPPHWCVHAHGIGLDWLSEAQIEGLKAAFPASRWCERPVRVDRLDQNVQARLYPFKPERVRRETYRKSDHPDRKPYRATKRRSLRPDQAVSLALVEHRLGFARRLMTRKIDREAFRAHLAGLCRPRDSPLELPGHFGNCTPQP